MKDLTGWYNKLSQGEKNSLNDDLFELELNNNELESKQIIPSGIKQDTYPLSFPQKMIWIQEYLEENKSAINNIPFCFNVKGNLDVNALQLSINDIIRRHQVFRTIFVIKKEQPFQVVLNEVCCNIKFNDISDYENKCLLSKKLLKEESKKDFDLTRAPLFRVSVYKLREEEHIILIVLHHIICDGWSLGILKKDLSYFYSKYSMELSHDIDDLEVQYTDYANWQNQLINKGELNNQLDYWTKRLKGVENTLNLPTDYPRKKSQTFKGDYIPIKIPKSTVNKLGVVGKNSQATLFMVLFAAYNILLYRYSKQTDILVGTPISNRNLAELEDVIGFFVNTLVIRSDLNGDPSFLELLERIRETMIDAYSNQDIPFEKVIETLQPERKLKYKPLFQTMFVLQNSPREVFNMSNLVLSPLEIHTGTIKFDLHMFLVEDDSNNGLKGWFSYNTDLFTKPIIERMLTHFYNLLEEITNNPNNCISSFALLNHKEAEYQILYLNNNDKKYNEISCIHHYFEHHAKINPNQIAIKCGVKELNYLQLETFSNKLANFLKKMGVGPEVLVGIFMNKSIDMIIGVLGILKAGGGYVPIDPGTPKERVQFILKDSKIMMILTDQYNKGVLENSPIKMFDIRSNWDEISQENKDKPLDLTKTDNVAYVIYTSGTTGVPKGVLVEHRQIINYINGITEEFNNKLDIHFAMISSLATDLCHTVMYGSLSTGGCLHIFTDQCRDPYLLAEYFHNNPIDVLKITPTHLSVLLSSENQAKYLLPKRKLYLGGELLNNDLVKKIQSLSNCTIYNHYGPTETTVGITTFKISPNYLGDIVPIGKPLANNKVYILDSKLQPLPFGAQGELFIGGKQVARGYLNQPKQTKEKFILNPFDPSTYLYKTGDIVRYLPDGNLKFIKRKDKQVKINGYRVEINEIEYTLTKHTLIKEAVVLVQPNGYGDNGLIAFYSSINDTDIPKNNLKLNLAKTLPEYMLPFQFIKIKEIPLTINGKADKNALMNLLSSEKKLVNNLKSISFNNTQKSLIKIWSEILGIDRAIPMQINDNFFEKGGNSLLAIRLLMKIRDKFNVNISLKTLFESPTIKELSIVIDNRTKNTEKSRIETLTETLELLESLPDEES